ncbi:prolyl oligopeptidase family serine peptidase [Xanthobacter sp. V4C-4]|uniref:alpha/beta hydrolase family protein n=1 Tax=Xanthobacter cornucopiae TaxID=3119924 RepID=UPI003728C3B6
MTPLPAGAAETAVAAPPVEAPVEVASGVSYQLIGRWDMDRLNRILTEDAPRFFGVAVAYTPARNAVRLYRVTYPSVIPERGNTPTVATGLLAVPDTADTRFPLLSYQHGTVYGRQQVPSFPEQSPETQLALAQFAGQGYLVIGADYFGLGGSREPEGYLVKESQQQAPYDLLVASRAVLAHMKLSASRLVLGGWSQGGFVTLALLEKLERIGVPVAAAATASAPADAFVGLNGFLSFPRVIDADWVPTLFILTAFSFEKYYGVPGLARSLLTDGAYDISRRLYEREPYDPAQVPTDLRALIRPDYFDPQLFAASTYGRLLKDRTNAYRWVIKSPVRTYYGEADEVISPGLGRLVMTYQQAMGAGNTAVEARSTGPTTHRGTYATAVPQWKTWFDGL